MKRPSLDFLFDMDGVLLDSELLRPEAEIAAFVESGLILAAEDWLLVKRVSRGSLTAATMVDRIDRIYTKGGGSGLHSR